MPHPVGLRRASSASHKASRHLLRADTLSPSSPVCCPARRCLLRYFSFLAVLVVSSVRAALVETAIKVPAPPTMSPTYATLISAETLIKPTFGDTTTAPPTMAGEVASELFIDPKEPTEPAVDPAAPAVLPVCQTCLTYHVAADATAGILCQSPATAETNFITQKCWSQQEFIDTCVADGRILCQRGVDWSEPANQCTRPTDILIQLDESASVSDENWKESIDFIQQYAYAMNGGPGGTRLGLGPDQVRISVVHWADNGQQTMGIPFRFTDNLGMFIDRVLNLKRKYYGLGCPGVALKVRLILARCITQ